MELFYLVGNIGGLLLLALVINFDDRRPMSTRLKYKYRVKDNSIFRKIIKFKDKKFYPCNYFKIVPIYFYSLLSVISLLLLLVEILANNAITNVISDTVFTIFGVCLNSISILYFLTITIWWEIIDNKEMQLDKKDSINTQNQKFSSKKKKK